MESLSARVERQRHAAATGTPGRSAAGGDGSPARRRYADDRRVLAETPPRTGSRSPSGASWWQAQHESVAQLDGLLTELGMPSTPSPLRRPRVPDQLPPGRSPPGSGLRGGSDFQARLDDFNGLIQRALTDSRGQAHVRRSLGRSAVPCDECEMRRESPTRIDVLRRQNERLTREAEEHVQAVRESQAENRQLKEDLSLRNSWIQEIIQQLSSDDGYVGASSEQRSGLRGWLMKVTREAELRSVAGPTALDIRTAEAHAGEMGIRERNVRARLVNEAQKAHAAQQMASDAKEALEQSNYRVIVTENEVNLLRQQLHQALRSHEKVSEELNESRLQERSLQGNVLALEKKLKETAAKMREKDEELHSLHANYSQRLQQLETLRREKATLAGQVQQGRWGHAANGLGDRETDAKDELQKRYTGGQSVVQNECAKAIGLINQAKAIFEEIGDAVPRKEVMTPNSVSERSVPTIRQSVAAARSPCQHPDCRVCMRFSPPRGQEGFRSALTCCRDETSSDDISRDDEQTCRNEDAEQLMALQGLESDISCVTSLADPDGAQGLWRYFAHEDHESGNHDRESTAKPWAELHVQGKKLSGFCLRRALKAVGKGFSLALSSVDAQVQRQLLLGVSARGIPNCTIVSLPLHAVVVSQGQLAHHMLILLTGRLKIWRNTTAHSSRIPGANDDSTDTVLTELVGEVSTEGGALLETESALSLPSLYTAMVANPSITGTGRQGEGAEVLSISSQALEGGSERQLTPDLLQ